MLTEITVVGDDDTGLLARITSVLYERDVSIEDIDQAEQDGVFRLTVRVDTTTMDCSRDQLRGALESVERELGVDVRVRFPGEEQGGTLAVLVTKESHCLEALLEAADSGAIDAEIGVVIGNHSTLRPLAEEHGVPFHDVGDESGVPDEAELLRLLDSHDVDLIALARYIRILSPEVVFRYRNRIINVHPSLLPAFPGAAAYRQALEAGVRITGVTAHYVTPDLDQGPIITQRAFNVPDGADEAELKDRGQPLEAEALIEAVRLHLRNEIRVEDGRTSVDADDAELGFPGEVEELLPAEPVDRETVAVDLSVPSDD